MSLPVIFRPEADEDVEASRDYYERVAGLGRAFIEEVDKSVERIKFMPLSYPRLIKNVRWCRVRRFPYVIYFRVKTDRIEVLGVLHGRRSPAVWKRRI